MLNNAKQSEDARAGAVARRAGSALLGLAWGLFLAWPAPGLAEGNAAASPAALASRPVGENHPASGAFAPLDASAWDKATWPLGAVFTAGEGSTLEVGVYSGHASAVLLEIYASPTGAGAAHDYWMSKGPDGVWRAALAQVPGKTLYAFRAWGPNWPFKRAWARGNSATGWISDCDSMGNRFNPNKVLVDPYARELSHEINSAALMAAGETAAIFGTGGADISYDQTYSGPATANSDVDRRIVDTGPFAPKSVAFVDSSGFGTKPSIAQKDTAIYETHLRGLSAHPSSSKLAVFLKGMRGFSDVKNVPKELRGTYAGAAYLAPYLKDLGYTTVEFLPIQESDNENNPTTFAGGSGGAYWGYMTNGFFAPDRHYAHDQSLGGPTAEFKAMVKAFHAAGLEVYLDVVYNHSGEGGLWDATTAAADVFEFRGLDNAAYYTLSGPKNNYYYDTTGCGTNLNAGSPPVRRLILASLNYWSAVMGVDGFRFDEAAELGHDGRSAFSPKSATLKAIADLAAEKGFKIIAEPWDMNEGEIGNFPTGWAVWNGHYRAAVRELMLGSASSPEGIGYADAFYGDYREFEATGGPQKSVNMVDCHDGFNLTDLVSYKAPTNKLLSWPFGPSDGGTSNNHSSDWVGDRALRRQVIRDFETFQILSRGVPMQVWGDEFGRTVNGNNNAYNVDSPATWNNYAMLASASPDAVPTGEVTAPFRAYADNLGTFAGGKNRNFLFLRYLLKLRRAHATFRQSDYSVPISYANADGSAGFDENQCLTPRITLSGSKIGDKDFLLMANLSPDPVVFTVPKPLSGTAWTLLVDTDTQEERHSNVWPASQGVKVSGTRQLQAHSMVLLMAP